MRVQQLWIAGTVVPCIPMEDAFFIDREKINTGIINARGQEYITVWDYIRESFYTLNVAIGRSTDTYDVIHHVSSNNIIVIFNISVSINMLATIAECFGLRGDTECIGIKDNKLTITIDLEK